MPDEWPGASRPGSRVVLPARQAMLAAVLMNRLVRDGGFTRQHYPVDRRNLEERPRRDEYLESLTPGERLTMVDQLTRDAWSFRSGYPVELRVLRHVGRVIRPGRCPTRTLIGLAVLPALVRVTSTGAFS